MSDASSATAPPPAADPFVIGRDGLDLAAFTAITAGTRSVRLGESARRRVEAGAAFRRELAAGDERIYGVNTGFGRLADTVIPPAQQSRLQTNLLRSHAVGWGPPLSRPEVRGMILLRSLSLAGGFSGARPEVIEQLLWLLEADLHPFVPSRGSVGASGDLAPLAHLGLVLMGEGHVLAADGRPRPAIDVLRERGREPLTLEAKEGLALINGTQLMTTLGLRAVEQGTRLLRWAVTAAALSVEALEASVLPFGSRYHELRPHREIADVAAALRGLLTGSEVVENHRDCARVQDPYSLRCSPQIIGPSLGVLRRARELFLREAHAVTDNPVLLPEEGRAVTGGHFHGQILALELDALYVAMAEIGDVAERRINLMLGGNGGRLPRFLAADPGLESGLMIAQYLAAALVCETRASAFPAAADSIPTSDNQEDHVSMGSVSALKLRDALARVEAVVALELITAARALQFITEPRWAEVCGRTALSVSPPLTAALRQIGRRIDLSPGDRPLTMDLAAVTELVHDEPPAPELADALVGLA
ncbi:MAG: histidine ammonia-lyase [Candidatus Krumholzibacteriia bacterium]